MVEHYITELGYLTEAHDCCRSYEYLAHDIVFTCWMQKQKTFKKNIPNMTTTATHKQPANFSASFDLCSKQF